MAEGQATSDKRQLNRTVWYGPLTRKGAAPFCATLRISLVCCTNNQAMLLCNLPLDTPPKVEYNYGDKDADEEEYASPVVGQRVGRRLLQVRSNRRSGMVPRVA